MSSWSVSALSDAGAGSGTVPRAPDPGASPSGRNCGVPSREKAGPPYHPLHTQVPTQCSGSAWGDIARWLLSSHQARTGPCGQQDPRAGRVLHLRAGRLVLLLCECLSVSGARMSGACGGRLRIHVHTAVVLGGHLVPQNVSTGRCYENQLRPVVPLHS